jgi:AraC-like DNA-binding protein
MSIASYVHSIVVLEDNGLKNDYIIPLIAKGLPSITFQVTGSASNNGGSNLVLYGQNLKPFEFRVSGHLTMIAYFLHPHILNNFFGFDANEATDLSIDLNFIQPAKDVNLKEQLLNAPSLHAQLQLMNDLILKIAGAIRTDTNKAIAFATNAIQKNNGLIPLKNIQEELQVTERTFQRLFEHHVGISPKTFSKVCQFNSAFQQLGNKDFSKLGDIAYQNGYADQSHLIRIFKEFTNVSPKEYLRQSAAFQG